MKVGIIGTGNVGKAFAKSASNAGHQVRISAAHPDHAEQAAGESGAQAAKSHHDAVKDADLIVLAVPANNVDEVVDALGPELDGKVIIDVTNPVNPQNAGHAPEGSSVSEKIQKKAPNAVVVHGSAWQSRLKMAGPTGEKGTSKKA